MSFAREFERWHGDPPPASPLYRDSAQPIPEPRSVPVQPSDTQLLNAIGASNTEIVYLLRAILAALGSTGERVSSVEVKTSTRGVDITTKAYSGSDIEPAGNAAVSEYLRVKARLEAELMGGSA